MNSLDFYLALLFGCKRDVARVAGKVGGFTDCVFTGLCGALPEAKGKGGGVQGAYSKAGRGIGKVAIFLVVVAMVVAFGCKRGARTVTNTDDFPKSTQVAYIPDTTDYTPRIAEAIVETVEKTLSNDETDEEYPSDNFWDFWFDGLLNHIILPNESTPIDRQRVAQIDLMIDDINAMSLKCDTFIFRPHLYNLTVPREFEGIYFDEQGRLRKFYYISRSESGGSTITAYYDENRNPIYIAIEKYSTAWERKEYYHIHNLQIVNFYIDLDMYWSFIPNEEEIEKKIDSIRPAIGSVLKHEIGSPDYLLTKYLHADTLLNFLLNNRTD